MTIHDNAIHLRGHKILVNAKKANRSLVKLTTRLSKSASSILNTAGPSVSTGHHTMETERPIATLRNSGNTCYLNSIIYVLRFTSGFVHNLHHLIIILQYLRNTSNIDGPQMNAVTSDSARLNDPSNSKVFEVIERLHDVFIMLHNMEHSSRRGSSSALLPNAFLQSVRDVNTIFCSDDQQDAHELLLHLFANICDTYNSIGIALSDNNLNQDSDSDIEDLQLISRSSNGKSDSKQWNFLDKDFCGTSVRRTKCLECENVTQCKEQFYDIAVPIHELRLKDRQRDPSKLYHEACLARETLQGNNKYYCNDCRHLNEAVRSIAFESLPNIMILQQKRFMQTNDGCVKVNTYMPTPVQLDCFCESCIDDKHHFYRLRGVVMHVGGTMQFGHYKAYVAASEHTTDFLKCTRNKSKTRSRRDFFAAMKSKYSKDKWPSGDPCPIRTCCNIKINSSFLDGKAWDCFDDVWLECNDDKVRPISISELEDELAYKEENMNTPYLLFYEKINR